MASYLLPRPFPYNASRFRFVFRMHLVAVIGLALVAVVLLRLSPTMVFVSYLLIFCMAMVILLTVVNALPPVRTAHTVDGEFLVLRQGLGFKLAVPLSKISKAKRSEVSSGRPGIKLDQANATLEVLASDREAVRLRLNEPVRYKGVDVDTILVDVLEPGDFIECIRERKKGAALLGKLGASGQPSIPIASVEEPEDADQVPSASPGRQTPARHPPVDVDERVPPRAPAALAKSVLDPRRRQENEPEEPSEEPERESGETDGARGETDEDEIELVPALPSQAVVQPRVVRIPKRKP